MKEYYVIKYDSGKYAFISQVGNREIDVLHRKDLSEATFFNLKEAEDTFKGIELGFYEGWEYFNYTQSKPTRIVKVMMFEEELF